MKTINQRFKVSYDFPVIFTRNAFDKENKSLYNVLRNSGQKHNRLLIVIDSSVLSSNSELPENIERYGDYHKDRIEFIASPLIVRGGEICKKEPMEVEKIHSFVDKHHLCRHSFILAIGGGAVLDAAGYAAATAHRGIRLIRMPTTTLAQNDSGVGVKNSINAFGRKNFLGTFTPPFAVINDFDFLNTLPDRDKRSGIAEAVKVALIKDRSFFDFLYAERKKLSVFAPDTMEKMIIRCAELHIEHISQHGDPFEYGSSRPLDFGHWSAHKIEELTDGDVQHGEAVAIGIALDSLYSYNKKLISEFELNKIFTTLEEIGFDLYHWALGWMDIEKALSEFQEHLGGELTITLLKGIGDKIDIHEVDTLLLRNCIDMLSARKRRKEHTHAVREMPKISKGNLRFIFS